MTQPFRIAGFASSKSLQENLHLQEQEVSSSGRRPSKDREMDVEMGEEEGPGNIEDEDTPSQSTAQHQYEDDEVEVVEMVLNNNPRGREVKEEKKEDLKKPHPIPLGNFARNLEMVAGAGPRIKGVKKFFRCELCLVVLSSQETMISHVSGTSHCKKLQLEEKAHRDKIREGRLPPDEPMQEFVKQIPVPASAKPKIPKRLHERIVNSEDPIIGLQFITEILPESDPEMEPHYECRAVGCGNKGSSNSMLSHLNGQNHKRNVAVSMDRRNSDLKGGALRRFAVDHSQNKEKLSKLIETIQSDRAYPWPAGKNPRGRERGGTGGMEVEDRGASGGGRGMKRPMRDQSEEKRGFGGKTKVVVKLPYPDKVEKPRTNEEAEEMVEMGRRLFNLVVSSEFPKFNQKQKENLTNVMEKIVGPQP